MENLQDSAIVQAIIARHLSSRPLPKSPDMQYEPSQNKDMGFLLNLAQKIGEQVKRGNPLPNIAATEHFISTATSELTGEGVNDRNENLQLVLDTLGKLDPDSPLARKMNNGLVSALYQIPTHPPTSFVDPLNKYRQADGSNNNLHFPHLGKAGMPYARSVQERTPIILHNLPSPGVVFDVLFEKRNNQDEDHPNGNSAMTFAFATLISLSLFDTDPKANDKNMTSSYLDLSSLYGNNQADQDKVRVKDGFGRLRPDCFSDPRLLRSVSPAAAVLMIIFNRNHNYIVEKLLQINEKKKWRHPSQYGKNAERCMQQDNEIFQTARLINCGHFMTVVLQDFIGGFLGKTRTGQAFDVKPFDYVRRPDGSPLNCGEGHHSSVEFDMIFRCHTALGSDDRHGKYKFGSSASTETINLNDFYAAASDVGAGGSSDPAKWTFNGLVRGADGKFKDDDLAAILHNATETAASRYGARSAPSSRRSAEMANILQAREWDVCTMNDFRKYLGLKPFESFEEWNPDPVIAYAAQQIYAHIDRLELYPGIFAEACVPVLETGGGFGCGYTLMHALLTEIVAVLRGDRFFTTDFTPAALTTWGYLDCQPDQLNGAWGANMPKLLFRHLPLNYTWNTVYGLFSFFTPAVSKDNLTKLGIANKYDFSKPKPIPPTKAIETLKAIRTVGGDPQTFGCTYNFDLERLTRGWGMFGNFDDVPRHDVDKQFYVHALWPDIASYENFARIFKQNVTSLIHQHSYAFDVNPGSPYSGKKYVDIVRNVINIASVRWGADCITGLSLKNEENPYGIFTEQEAWAMFSLLFITVFLDTSPEVGFKLRDVGLKFSEIINATIERSLKQTTSGVSSLLSKISGQSIANKPCYAFLSRLSASGRCTTDLIGTVIGMAVGSVFNYAHACALVVNFYLDEERAAEKQHIVELVAKDDKESRELLLGYIKEAQRLRPQFPRLYREIKKPVVVEQGNGKPPVKFEPGDMVWASYKEAFIDGIDFPDPLKVDPKRDRSYWPIVQSAGFHICPGVKHVEYTFVEIIRVIFSLKNLRRPKGELGQVPGFTQYEYGTQEEVYLDDAGNLSPNPPSLIVEYDP